MEHIQKIPYLLSIFFPIALFFGLGLFLARWIWHRHANRLRLALMENKSLTGELKGLDKIDLNKIVSSKATGTDSSKWELKLADKDKELTSSRNLVAQKDKELNKKDARITELTSAESKYKAKLDSEKKRYSDLDLSFGNFKTEKAKELNALSGEKNTLKASLDGGSNKEAELEAKLSSLQSDHDRIQLEKKGSSETINKLIAKVDALEAEKAKGSSSFKFSDINLADLSKDELVSLQGDLDTKSGELGITSKKDDEINNLKGQLKGKGSSDDSGKDQEIQSLKGKVSDLETQLGEKSSELKTAKAGLSSSASSTPAGKVNPDLFFAGSEATRHDKYGYLYNNKPKYTDKLTEIKGVGEVLEPKLNKAGVYQFKQIALWDQENIDTFSEDLDFPGRVEREQWINQAADLHRKHHGEHLAPVIDIYHPQARAAKTGGPSLDDFKGEDVKMDEKLGVVYASRPAEVDDLKKIKGVAKVLEGKLHEIGIYRFKQIANWDIDLMTEFSNHLAFPGRIERDDWKSQAIQFHTDKYNEKP